MNEPSCDNGVPLESLKEFEMKKLISCAALLLLAGCQTWGPTWSELTGSRYNDVTVMTDGAVVVNQVDGATPSGQPREPIKLTPGKHTLVLSAVSPASVMGTIYQEQTEIDFKPCTRYYVNSRFASSTSTSWRPFVDREETISDCQVPPAKAK
jgi:hypothetical protein